MLTHVMHDFVLAWTYLFLFMVMQRFYNKNKLKRIRSLVRERDAAARSEGYEAGRRDCLKELEQGKIYR